MTFVYEPLEGGAVLQKRLDEISERADDLAPAFAAIIESFHEIEQARFDNNGPGWLPLSASTMSMTGSWARGNQNFDQILQDSGVLLASLKGGAGSYERVTPFSVEVGTTVPYAHWHQSGGDRLHASGAGWPPQRKIVDVTEETAVEWAGIVQGWLFDGEVK